jgi:hypothetical protein
VVTIGYFGLQGWTNAVRIHASDESRRMRFLIALQVIDDIPVNDATQPWKNLQLSTTYYPRGSRCGLVYAVERDGG